jgi:hypothetical protein
MAFIEHGIIGAAICATLCHSLVSFTIALAGNDGMAALSRRIDQPNDVILLHFQTILY